MPPPPPPSKSYLWKFDSISSDDDNDNNDNDNNNNDSIKKKIETKNETMNETKNETKIETKNETMNETKNAYNNTNNNTSNNTNNNTNDPERQQNHPDSATQNDDSTAPITSTQVVTLIPISISTSTSISISTHENNSKKHKQKKRRNRQTKKKPLNHNVSFGTVSIHSFSRTLGTSVIPLEGGWPLGIGQPIAGPAEIIPLETHQTEKQLLLMERWNKQQQQQQPIAQSTITSSLTLTLTLETRPYDYKTSRDAHGISQRNPLFGPLNEDQRMALLTTGTTKVPTKSSDHHSEHTGTRPRSHSDLSRRPRSKSFGSGSSNTNGPYSSTELLQVRQELEDVRVSRTTELGCSCRKLTVYIPPKDNSIGKKAAHRRMNERKVKDELRKRGIVPVTTMNRDALEQLLHDTISLESSCCTTLNDCPCVRNGMNCQADTCRCWHSTTLTNHKKHPDDMSSVEQIKERCGNKFGIYVVDVDAISEFRMEMLCQVIPL